MPNEPDLSGHTAIVTGASSGIGRAIAERMGAAGAHVFIGGRAESALEESAARIVASGGRATIHVGDVRDPRTVRDVVDMAVKSDGRLDILVNNAGYFWIGPLLGGDDESWRLTFETNVLALLAGCQAAVAAMRATGNAGHIVNISSVAALDPASGVYGASKHAVNVITNTLRNELANDPIQVTTIMPGLVATNLGRYSDPAILAGFVAASGIDYEIRAGERIPDDILESAQTVLSDIIIRPDDVAAAVMYVLGQPPSVDITQIVIRPNQHVNL